jgi:hypothetical protein
MMNVRSMGQAGILQAKPKITLREVILVTLAELEKAEEDHEC